MSIDLNADLDLGIFDVSADFSIDGNDDGDQVKRAHEQRLIERYAPRIIKYAAGINVPATGTGFQFITDSPAEKRRLEIRRFHLDIAQPISSAGTVVTSPGASGTIVQANQAGTGAASAITLTVPAAVGVTNQVSGFTVSGTGATGASTIVITLAGVQGGTQSFDYVVPAGAAAAAPTLEVNFNPPLQASGPNVAIVLTVPSFGAGNLASAAELEAQAVTPATGISVFLVADPGNVSGNPNQYLHSLSVLKRYNALPIDDTWGGHEMVVNHPENVWIVVANGTGVAVALSGNIQTVDYADDEFTDPQMVYHILKTFNTDEE